MKKVFFILTVALFLTQTQSSNAETKNTKLINKQNIEFCSNFKSKYSVKILDSWSKEKSSDEDLLKEVDSNIKLLSKYNKKTSKTLKSSINQILDSENMIKEAIKKENLDNILSSLSLRISAIKKTQKICDSTK
jgi:hypothetical protein